MRIATLRTCGAALPTALRRRTAVLLIAFVATSRAGQSAADEQAGAHLPRAALLTADLSTEARLHELRASGYSAVAVMLGQTDERSATADEQAAERIAKAGLELWYWIEIARCPELADAHPRWMASLQGHAEWRRLHDDFPQPQADEVVKVYPWTPIFYREAYDAHLLRVKQLLADRPPARCVVLNDLQGAPSACGCGNPVCRWTTDYGPIVTATRLGDGAPAEFVADVRRLAPDGTRIVPVWTTECEEHDKAKEALCAGVGCYQGICWKAYSRQLSPLAAEADILAALLLYKEFRQDGPPFEQRAGWIRHALRHGFTDQHAKHGGTPIAASRLIAVLQGWEVGDAEIQAQIDQASIAGAAGCIVALAPIDQSWQPQLLKWK